MLLRAKWYQCASLLVCLDAGLPVLMTLVCSFQVCWRLASAQQASLYDWLMMHGEKGVWCTTWMNPGTTIEAIAAEAAWFGAPAVASCMVLGAYVCGSSKIHATTLGVVIELCCTEIFGSWGV